MDKKQQQAILDRAYSYASENPYEDEGSYQPGSNSQDDDLLDMENQITIQRQLNS